MNEKIKKMLVTDNIILIIGIIFVIGIFGCAYWAYDIYKIDLDNPEYLYNVKKSSKYAFVNSNDYPWKFASDDNYKYVFIQYFYEYDGEQYTDMPIVALKNEEYEELYKYYEEADKNGDDEPFLDGISLVGVSHFIDDDIKKYALDLYKEEYPDSLVTLDNFSDYFGDYYLKVNEDPKDYSGPIVCGIMLIVFGSFFIIGGIKGKVITKNTLNSEVYERAMNEIESPEWETNKAIFTKNYIVYVSNGLRIIDYKDIDWVYRYTYRYNGIPTHYFAYYVKGSKKRNLINNGFSEKIVNEMVEYIANKNPNALIGYTEDNKKIYKERV